jgi:hypothetical protein
VASMVHVIDVATAKVLKNVKVGKAAPHGADARRQGCGSPTSSTPA